MKRSREVSLLEELFQKIAADAVEVWPGFIYPHVVDK